MVTGVGRADEVDPWGRDDELGYASQVAIFRRMEGGEYAELRKQAWMQAKKSILTIKEEMHHELMAMHEYKRHPSANCPLSLGAVGALVEEKMRQYGEPAMTVDELWRIVDISAACGGYLCILVEAIEASDSLLLSPEEGVRRSEWSVRCEGVDPVDYFLRGEEQETISESASSDGPQEGWDQDALGTFAHHSNSGLGETSTENDGWARQEPESTQWEWGNAPSTNIVGWPGVMQRHLG